jgi:hypothetical protein
LDTAWDPAALQGDGRLQVFAMVLFLLEHPVHKVSARVFNFALALEPFLVLCF